MNATRFTPRTAALVATTGALILCATAASVPPPPTPPATIELTGTIRDFIERGKPGGHTDFEVTPSLGFGLYNGNIGANIGSDGKPVFTGAGWLTKTQWKDASGRPICYRLYDSSIGDVKGSKGSASTGGIANAASFNQWFNDVPGVNLSAPLSITLVRQDDGSYVFDDKLDPAYSSKGGFFPIDGQMYGNSGGTPVHNFHFTYELHTKFTYLAGQHQVFRFIGDDDVWVYIDGRLVIDLGGVHGAQDQTVTLNRLGLTDGQEYTLDFFFAERHRTQSNFRIATNLQLSSLAVPSVTAAFD